MEPAHQVQCITGIAYVMNTCIAHLQLSGHKLPFPMHMYVKHSSDTDNIT